MTYRSVDDAVIGRLQALLGADAVFSDEDNLERYSRDETTELSGRPEVVVKPENTEGVSLVMRLADELVVPVTARSGGTGVTGGAVASMGGIVLSFERMNTIIEVDADNLMAVVQPGVITGVLARAAAADGLMYPPDPASIDSCCIGGNVSESAGGPSAVKYGTTKDYVTGLEVVFADGSLSRLGGKVVKNATGYNLIGLMIGSEGTLGLFTEITVRLIPMPAFTMDLLVPFDDLFCAARAASDIIRARVVPATIEFIQREATEMAERFLQKKVPFADAGAQLLIRLDGDDRNDVERQMERLWEAASAHGAQDIITADSTATSDRLWEARRCLREAIVAESEAKEGEDVVVPRKEIPPFVAGAKDLLDGLGLSSIFFGHIGDGNVHVEIIKGRMSADEWKRALPAAREGLYRLAARMGGLLTGEHGIGSIRREYLPISLDAAQMDVMRRIKTTLDPKNILNPKKIFPEIDPSPEK
ncbi:MAG: FAD-binding protein [Deltaproteobacteria bacterium]|nr:FAD-binding protein [Candidatus Zymogenaceae bacterium]